MAPKIVQMLNEELVVPITNFVGFGEIEAVHPCFRPIMGYLKNSSYATAIFEKPIMFKSVLVEVWTSASFNIATDGVSIESVSFKVQGKEGIISPAHLNEALGLPNSNFQDSPTENDLLNFLLEEGYACDNPVGLRFRDLKRVNCNKELSYLFDTITKVFAGKCSNFEVMTSLTLVIAYAMIKNVNFNIGELVFNELINKLGPKTARKTEVYYARFLVLVVLHQIRGLDLPNINAANRKELTIECTKQNVRLFNEIMKKSQLQVPYQLPEHMQQVTSQTQTSPIPYSLPSSASMGQGTSHPDPTLDAPLISLKQSKAQPNVSQMTKGTKRS